MTSPLKGRKTMQLYSTLKSAVPKPSRMLPLPTLPMPVTQMTNPYLPLHVPSTCKSHTQIGK